MSQADRKQQLIAQGALHRAEIMIAKDTVRDSVRPEALAHAAMQQLTSTVFSVIGKSPITVFREQAIFRTVFPILLSAISTLAKRKIRVKLLVGSFLGASLTAAVATWVLRKKNAETTDVRPHSRFM